MLLIATSQLVRPVVCGGLRGAEGGGVRHGGPGSGISRGLPRVSSNKGNYFPGQTSSRRLQVGGGGGDSVLMSMASCGDNKILSPVSNPASFC